MLLASHVREGARPVPVLLGTLVGATPVWFVLADSRPTAQTYEPSSSSLAS